MTLAAGNTVTLSMPLLVFGAVVVLALGWALCRGWDYLLDWMYDAGWIAARGLWNLCALGGIVAACWVGYLIAT